jgi:hypothetical protein
MQHKRGSCGVGGKFLGVNRQHGEDWEKGGIHSDSTTVISPSLCQSFLGRKLYEPLTFDVTARELLWESPDHMKRLLRSSVFSWR